MNNIMIWAGEWPWIFTMSLAVYLAFEYWRFPDLTIESSFVAGMAAVYVAVSNGSSFSGGALILGMLIIFIPAAYSFVTWILTFLRFPPLFAGLVVALGGYSINYHINGNSISQTLYFRSTDIPAFLRVSGLTPSHHLFVLSVVFAVFTALMVGVIDRTRVGNRLWLSRRTADPNVPAALGLRGLAYIYLAMLIYNSVAFLGGVGLAFQESISAVSVLGAVAPGVAVMFVVRAVKEYAALPSRGAIGLRQQRLAARFIGMADSYFFIVTILGLLALGVSVVRVLARSFTTLGMLNAYTALGTIGLWVLISLIAMAFGKRVTGRAVDDY